MCFRSLLYKKVVYFGINRCVLQIRFIYDSIQIDILDIYFPFCTDSLYNKRALETDDI